MLLSPWFLPAFAALAVPVLLHLLHRRKRKTLHWGAMQFLRPDKRSQRRRSLRIKDWMLLLLRLLAVAAIVAFFLRPQAPLGHVSGVPRDVVLVLDTSLSTQQRIKEREAWALIQDQARAALDRLSSDDAVRLLLAGDTPTWLTPSALAGDAAGRAQAASLLAATEPTLGQCHWPAALTEAVLARAARPGMSREIVVLTDGQANGVEADNTAAWTSLRDAAADCGFPCRIEVLSVGPEVNPANLALTRLEASREHAAPGDTLQLRARVRNFGPSPSTAAGLRWRLGEQGVGAGSVPSLQPGQETSVDFALSVPSKPGVHEVTCELSATRGDVLAADNQASLLIETLDAVNVLVADGSGQADPQRSDTAWIMAALADETAANEKPAFDSSQVATAFKTRLLPWADLEAAPLEKTHAILLANPRPPTPALRARLEAFVRQGGGLWLLLGDQMTESAAADLFAKGQGLSPLRWLAATGQAGDESQALGLRVASAEHPVTRLLADVRRSDLDRVRVSRRFTFASDLGEGASVLLRCADGSPFLAEKPLGAGRVLVQAAPFSFAWSTWPKQQSFVVLLHEGLWRVASPQLIRRNLKPNEPLHWPLAEGLAEVSVRLPSGSKTSARIEASPGGLRQARFTETARPGLYTLEGAGIDARLARWQVARESAESLLAPLSQGQREAMSQSAGLSFVTQPLASTSGGEITAKPLVEITPWFAAAALLALLLESSLATWLLRRRHRAMQATA